MTQFRLLNNVIVGSARLLAGTLIDDTQEAPNFVANVRTAGGRLEPNTGALAAAAATATGIKLRGGSEEDMQGIMLAAAAEQQETKGADLTDADATITPDQGDWRVLPAATLTAARTLTLGTTGAQAGDVLTVTRLDLTAFPYSVVNGGGGGGTLVVLQGNSAFQAEFDGTNWVQKGAGVAQPAKGANLTDAAVTIQPAAGYWRVLPAATLSAGRVLTLGTTGARAGDLWTITRLDAGAFTYAIANGGGGGGTLVTMPASKVNFAVCQFDGVDWALKMTGTQ